MKKQHDELLLGKIFNFPKILFRRKADENDIPRKVF